jgi:uncharacterized damage-inducible protein DinB
MKGAPMKGSAFDGAFAHHVWATLELIDACDRLSADQLEPSVPGTFGSILATMRHLVSADRSYLALLVDGRLGEIDEESGNLLELRAAMEADGIGWRDLLAGDPDPRDVIVRHRDDGSESRAPLALRLAQAIHHGTDHRSQICTALTSLGVEPPEIDVWAYAAATGQLEETAPGS